MASSIGEVLDIESPDSYIKRSVGPMVTVEVKDISKLTGIIRIPSMTEGAGLGNTTALRILYSGLLNQSRKCRKFEHPAKIYPLNRSPTQSGSIPTKPHLEWREKKERGENPGVQRWNTNKVRRTESQQGNEGTHPAKAIPDKVGGTDPHYPEIPQHTINKNLTTKGEGEKKKKELVPLPPTHTLETDQEMPEHITPLPHRQKDEQQGLYIQPIPVFSPRARLYFAPSDLANT
jgi:hypothetical protein